MTVATELSWQVCNTVCTCCPSSYIALPTLRTVEYHLFLIALSVRPGSDLAISAHFVPILFRAVTITDTPDTAAAGRSSTGGDSGK